MEILSTMSFFRLSTVFWINFLLEEEIMMYNQWFCGFFCERG